MENGVSIQVFFVRIHSALWADFCAQKLKQTPSVRREPRIHEIGGNFVLPRVIGLNGHGMRHYTEQFVIRYGMGFHEFVPGEEEWIGDHMEGIEIDHSEIVHVGRKSHNIECVIVQGKLGLNGLLEKGFDVFRQAAVIGRDKWVVRGSLSLRNAD